MRPCWKKRESFLLIVLLAGIFPRPCLAPPRQPPAAGSAAESPSLQREEERQALSAFFEAIGLKASVEVAVDSYISGFGERSAVSPAQERQLRARLTWAKLESEFAGIYAKRLNARELSELTAFLNSPVGRKYLMVMPEMQQEALQAVRRRFDAAIEATTP